MTNELELANARHAQEQMDMWAQMPLTKYPLPASEPVHPLDVQIGGGHYKDMKIQPVEYILANAIPFVEGSVIKYVSRWRSKGGVEDLRKARHFLDMLIAHEEGLK